MGVLIIQISKQPNATTPKALLSLKLFRVSMDNPIVTLSKSVQMLYPPPLIVLFILTPYLAQTKKGSQLSLTTL